jgi:hypothetical protein
MLQSVDCNEEGEATDSEQESLMDMFWLGEMEKCTANDLVACKSTGSVVTFTLVAS